jgi:hypothetical protein
MVGQGSLKKDVFAVPEFGLSPRLPAHFHAGLRPVTTANSRGARLQAIRILTQLDTVLRTFKRQSSQPCKEHVQGHDACSALPGLSGLSQIRSEAPPHLRISLLSTFCCEDITREGASLQVNGTAKARATKIILHSQQDDDPARSIHGRISTCQADRKCQSGTRDPMGTYLAKPLKHITNLQLSSGGRRFAPSKP